MSSLKFRETIMTVLQKKFFAFDKSINNCRAKIHNFFAFASIVFCFNRPITSGRNPPEARMEIWAKYYFVVRAREPWSSGYRPIMTDRFESWTQSYKDFLAKILHNASLSNLIGYSNFQPIKRLKNRVP